MFQGCPGSRMMDFSGGNSSSGSALRQWPVQLHLVAPTAPYFRGRDVVLAADCTAFAMGKEFHRYIEGKSIAVACPKLDDGLDEYEAKIRSMVEDARINTLTVLIMEVPCCRGLTALAVRAVESASRKVPVKQVVVGIDGTIVSEEWL